MGKFSIYRSPEGEAEIAALYEEAMAWLRPGCETLCATGEAFVYAAMTRLMVRRLARA